MNDRIEPFLTSYLPLLLAVLLAVTLAWTWRRLRVLERRMNGLNARTEIVYADLLEHTGAGHESRLIVIADRPDAESEEAMKGLAAEWGWKV